MPASVYECVKVRARSRGGVGGREVVAGGDDWRATTFCTEIMCKDTSLHVSMFDQGLIF
jgi:hypothetical protein